MSLEAAAKAEKLIAWFAGKTYEKTLRLNSYTNIIDVAKYIDSNATRMRKLTPLTQQWRMCYYRLYHLKQKIETT